jgi:hypothetical protein
MLTTTPITVDGTRRKPDPHLHQIIVKNLAAALADAWRRQQATQEDNERAS